MKTLPLDLGQSADRFFMSKRYAHGYSVFTMSSNECHVVGSSIRSILKRRAQRQSLLDIGSADGRALRKYATLFQTVELFEPNPILYSLAVSGMEQARIDLLPHNRCFDHNTLVYLTPVSAVVLSHSLYHIAPASWLDLLRRATEITTKGGAIVVVLWNPESEARKITSEFDPDRWGWGAEELLKAPMLELLEDQRLELKRADAIETHIKTHTIAAAEQVAEFFLGCERIPSNAEVFDRFVRAVNGCGVGNAQTVITFEVR